MQENPKRFIAGAICPSCQRIDKIQYQKVVSGKRIECIGCGYSQVICGSIARREPINNF